MFQLAISIPFDKVELGFETAGKNADNNFLESRVIRFPCFEFLSISNILFYAHENGGMLVFFK